jgi:D-alanyl-D-alanine carboxypeptidase (penicillin-binding protein 5/6)
LKNKIILLIICLLVCISNVNALDIESSNAILYNLNTDEVIYEKNSEEEIKIASLTKIMTTIVAIENIDNILSKVTITNDMIEGLIEANAMVIGFKVGDIVTYEDLLYATLLPSAADAAQALAISISGSVDEYIKLMNDKAKLLGLNNTLFTNTTGLDYKDNHSTVKDVSILLKYCLNNETFKKMYETKYYTSTTGLFMMSNLEKNLIKYNLDIDYIKGSKTGYTTLAGLCLSSIASYNSIDYLLVTCGADPTLDLPYNIIDSDKIYKYYFENYSKREILKKDNVLVSIDNKYSNNKIDILSDIDYSLYMLESDYNNLEYEYVGLNEINVFTKDKVIGKYNIILNGEIIKTIDIYKPENIEFSIIIFILNYLYIFIPIVLILLIIIRRLYASKNSKSRILTN